MTRTEPEVAPVRPFGGLSLLASGALGGLVLWYAAFPSMYYLAWLVMIAGMWTLSFVAPVLHMVVVPAMARLRGRKTKIATDGLSPLLVWLLAISFVVAFELPLRAHFALAQNSFEVRRSEHAAGSPIRGRWVGAFYVERITPGRCDESRTLFWIDNDVESAIVHSPGGIDGLCYNSGNAGHLVGDWYWMTED